MAKRNTKIRGSQIFAEVADSGLKFDASENLYVAVDDSGIEITTDVLNLKDLGVTTAKINTDAVDKTKIAADIAGLGLSQAAGGELDVNVDASTLEMNVDTLRVKAAGITEVELNASVAGAGLSGGAGSALAVVVDASTIEINVDTLRVKASGITDNEILVDTISESKLDVHNAPTSGNYMKYTANGMEWVDIDVDMISPSDIISSEVPAGLVDDLNVTYTLANTPLVGTVRLYLNGLRQEAGDGKDYTITGTAITMAAAPATGDIILADYFIA